MSSQNCATHLLRLGTKLKGAGRTSRYYTNTTQSSSQPKWDKIFEGVEPLRNSTINRSRYSQRSRNSDTSQHTSWGSSRQTKMTTQELKAFNRILDVTFGSSKRKDVPANPAFVQFQEMIRNRLPQRRVVSEEQVVADSLGQEEVEMALDEKQEEMDHCRNDYELLMWAIGLFQRQSELLKGKGRSTDNTTTISPSSSMGSASQNGPALERTLYPHLISKLMKTFRDRYHDPHLALSIFDFARNHSIQSFVLGCTTPAYNELLRTLWKNFRNLKRVSEALDDMEVNGITPDAETLKFVEDIAAELNSQGDLLNATEIGHILKRMESMAIQHYGDRQRRPGQRIGLVLDDWDEDESSFAFR